VPSVATGLDVVSTQPLSCEDQAVPVWRMHGGGHFRSSGSPMWASAR